jgi:hypothetical protein
MLVAQAPPLPLPRNIFAAQGNLTQMQHCNWHDRIHVIAAGFISSGCIAGNSVPANHERFYLIG